MNLFIMTKKSVLFLSILGSVSLIAMKKSAEKRIETQQAIRIILDMRTIGQDSYSSGKKRDRDGYSMLGLSDALNDIIESEGVKVDKRRKLINGEYQKLH
jgi:hypothetical protein